MTVCGSSQRARLRADAQETAHPLLLLISAAKYLHVIKYNHTHTHPGGAAASQVWAACRDADAQTRPSSADDPAPDRRGGCLIQKGSSSAL